MRLEILLEPPGPVASGVWQEWLGATDLQVADGGQVEVNPDRCLDLLVELRHLCYERELTINVKFNGQED